MIKKTHISPYIHNIFWYIKKKTYIYISIYQYIIIIWAMVNTHYTVDGHPIHNKDPLLMVIINPYEPLDD